MNAQISTADSIISRFKLTRVFAFGVIVAMLCFGMVATSAMPAHAASQTVSGKIVFPASAPANVRQALDDQATGNDRTGVYLTLYKDQPGTVEGWQLGTDANVLYNASSGVWSITDVPDGQYRLTINVIAPNNGSSLGTQQIVTVANADKAIGNTAIPERGMFRGSFGLCGWQAGDDVKHFVKNVDTGAVTQLVSGQSGWGEPSTLCPPEVSYGNYGAPTAGITAGTYIAYTTWNGNTHYYAGDSVVASSSAAKARQVTVQNWVGSQLLSLVPAQVSAGKVTVAGTAKVEQTLTANATGWTAGATFSYQWLRGATAISGAKSASYKLVGADADQKISVKVTGAKASYEPKTKQSTAVAVTTASFTTTSVPTITGTAKYLNTLTANPGTWAPAVSAADFSYQWLRANAPIGGATGKTYTLVAADAGEAISVKVTGKKLGYTPVARTSATTSIERGTLTAATPTISGTAKAGNTLTANPGEWQPIADQYSYQWLRDGKTVGGATKQKLTLTSADAGAQFSVTVTGTKAGFEQATKTSAKTAKVIKGAYVPLKTSPFKDVATNYKFYDAISWMYTEGLSTGVKTATGRDYQPKVGVSREAMAAFLYRLEEATYKGPKVSPFNDVKPGDKFYNEIAWMHAQGLSTGVKTSSGRDYQPKTKVSREAMAAFIYRLEDASTKGPKASPFADVKPGAKFYNEIAWMSTSGLSTGIKQPSGKPFYAPKAQVSREAMAAFLFRLETQK